MENPALAKRGVPEVDQAGASIKPEYATATRTLQALHLTRRYPISSAMAEIVAPLAFGEAA